MDSNSTESNPTHRKMGMHEVEELSYHKETVNKVKKDLYLYLLT